MIGYLVRRVLRAVTTLLGTTLIIFVLVRVVPADPAVSIAGPKADAETLAMIRKDLGLDDPLVVQYGRYLGRLARGDFGRAGDRKSTRLNSSHLVISYAVFCLKKKKPGRLSRLCSSSS